MLPQPSPAGPHTRVSCAHVFGWRMPPSGAPPRVRPLTPPPPQPLSPAGAEPLSATARHAPTGAPASAVGAGAARSALQVPPAAACRSRRAGAAMEPDAGSIPGWAALDALVRARRREAPIAGAVGRERRTVEPRGCRVLDGSAVGE